MGIFLNDRKNNFDSVTYAFHGELLAGFITDQGRHKRISSQDIDKASFQKENKSLLGLNSNEQILEVIPMIQAD